MHAGTMHIRTIIHYCWYVFVECRAGHCVVCIRPLQPSFCTLYRQPVAQIQSSSSLRSSKSSFAYKFTYILLPRQAIIIHGEGGGDRPHTKSTRYIYSSMQVIGASYGRTGTASMREALHILGVGPCYHSELTTTISLHYNYTECNGNNFRENKSPGRGGKEEHQPKRTGGCIDTCSVYPPRNSLR